MNREINNIVDKIISEEFNKRIDSIKNKIFEDSKMKKQICSECGSKNMYENECMECGTMYEGSNKGQECSECGGMMYEGECMECGTMYEGDIQELGGMDDGHPRLGKKRLPKRMSPEEIEKMLKGDDEISFEDDDMPNIRRMKRYRGDSNQDEIKEYSPKDEIENNYSFYEEFCSQIHNMDHPDCAGYYRYTSKLDDKKSYTKSKDSELGEELKGNQRRIDKNKNNRIDAEDFKILRRGKKTETKEECTECGDKYELYLDESTGERFIFSENEIIDIIENIVLEEKKKKKKKTTTRKSDPIKLTRSNQEKSKKENDDYIDSVVKKMKDYLKTGSKGSYEMKPKHFPKGNGELAKMSKMAYVPSDAVGEYIDNFTAAGLENLDYDEIHPNEKWVEDLTMGSSRTGNNPEWANAVETPNNKNRNKIRKDNLLAKIKRKAYNKAPQPILTDKSGGDNDKASKIMMKLESQNERKVISDIEKMKSLISYGKKTQ
jgi:hypothetical protein